MTEVFKPKPGQIDYTNIRQAPVVNCVLQYGDKILLVHRSRELRFYPDCWNGISGFLDDAKPLEEKVKEELREEVGLGEDAIISITIGAMFEREDEDYNKTWLTHPVLVEVNTDKIKLDFEASEYKWIDPREAKSLKLLPGFERVLQAFFKI